MRDELLGKMEQNLQQQLAIYTELDDSAHQKQQALVKNQIKELDALVACEEILVMKLGKLEAKRIDLANQICDLQGPSSESITLSYWFTEYPQFRPIQKEIEHILKNIQETNNINNGLLEQAVNIVNFTLHLLTLPDEQTYYRDRINMESKKQLPNKAYFVDKSI